MKPLFNFDLGDNNGIATYVKYLEKDNDRYNYYKIILNKRYIRNKYHGYKRPNDNYF